MNRIDHREKPRRARALAWASRLVRPLVFVQLQMAWPALRRLPWLTVWVVNAGRREDVLAMGPEWLALGFARLNPVVPISFLITPRHGLSLVVGNPCSNEQLQRDPKVCRSLLRGVSALDARRVALNGVVPSALHGHGIWPEADARFVRAQLGTLFMLSSNVAEIRARHPELFAARPRVAIVGVGYTGAQVANRLAKEGYAVMGVDRRSETGRALDPSVEFVGDDFSAVARASIVVLLTVNGDDAVASVRPHLRPGTVVLSDTHPKVSSRTWRALFADGILGYESTLAMRGALFFPKIPRWSSDSIPGCVGQALVEAITEREVGDMDTFVPLAQQIGLEGRLDDPHVRLERAAQRQAPGQPRQTSALHGA